MENIHTGVMVERVKSFMSLYTVYSPYTVQLLAIGIAKLDLLTVVSLIVV